MTLQASVAFPLRLRASVVDFGFAVPLTAMSRDDRDVGDSRFFPMSAMTAIPGFSDYGDLSRRSRGLRAIPRDCGD
jgi:hypothetical protein